MAEENMAAAVQPERKEIVTEVFVRGAKKGWGIAIGSMLPNVVMAFVIIKALNITGILTLVGDTCGPVMEIFGLPGEAIVVLLGAWLSAGGGVGTAIALHSSGALNGTDLAILTPAIFLMGSQVQYNLKSNTMKNTVQKYLFYLKQQNLKLKNNVLQHTLTTRAKYSKGLTTK